MTQLSNVLMQPNPADAVEPLTLIEKLEREYQKWCELEDKSEFGSGEAIDARGRTRGLKDAINIVKQHEAESEVQEDYKTLTQDVFKDAPDWVKSAAVDDDGEVMFYEVLKQNLIPDRCGMWCFYNVDHERMYQCLAIAYDYDTTHWQHSAIDRE